MKKCPYCAEEIPDDTEVCPHCGRTIMLRPGQPTARAVPVAVATPVNIEAGGQAKWDRATAAVTVTAAKPYRTLRIIQWFVQLFGWVCLVAAPIFAVLIFSASGGALIVLIAAFGVFISLASLGIAYLAAGQLLEVFIDIAANTGRSAQLLEKLLGASNRTAIRPPQ